MTVYKYRDTSSRSLEILLNKELYFARPVELNDPLDGQIDMPTVYSSLHEFMRNLQGEVGDKLGFLVHILNEHKFEPKDNIGRKVTLTDAIKEFVSSRGICSLSRTPNDALLWSHYGAGHTGFCIGFDESQLKLDGVFICGDVEYHPTPPHKQIFLDLASELGDLLRPWDSTFASDPGALDRFYTMQLSRMMRANLLVKSDLWRYEREYRLIRSEAGRAKFNPSAVREIVLGSKTSKEDRRAIVHSLAQPEWAHVRIRRVYQDSLSFDFTVLRESFCSPSDYLKTIDGC